VAFYYWRTTFDLTPTERRVLEDCDVKHLYIRYFDVKIDPASGMIVPEAPVRFRSLPPKGIRVTPVVFITNRVMLRRETNVDTLAVNIAAYIRRINRAVGLPEPDEVQTAALMRCIYDGAKAGNTAAYAPLLAETVATIAADSLILACTELPLFLPWWQDSRPVIDSTDALARAAVAAAREAA